MYKLKVSFVFFILLGFNCGVMSQTSMNPREVKQIMQLIPDSSTFSTFSITNYIDSNFRNQGDKACATYYWITENILYDIENKYEFSDIQYSQIEIDNILKSRNAICQEYSVLFSDLANKLGIKTYVIKGYTKRKENVIQNPHSWNASLIDSVWYLFDLTWGAGYLEDEMFIKKIDYKYFKVKPSQFIKTHIPFDPLWQFLEYPYTKKEFSKKIINVERETPYFNYIDSLKRYENQSKIERILSARTRIELNGINNYLDYDNLYHLKFNISYEYKIVVEEKYNIAISYFNEGIYKFNEYITYRNNQYLPYRGDIEIYRMIEDIERLLYLSIEELNKIEKPIEVMGNSIIQLRKNINKTNTDILFEKEKLNSYFETFKIYREKLSQDSLSE